jgi:hypothetical protein
VPLPRATGVQPDARAELALKLFLDAPAFQLLLVGR